MSNSPSIPEANIRLETPQIHAYLAGPDVFYPDAVARGAEKKQKLSEVGIIGHYPFDNELNKVKGESDRAFGLRIGKANEEMMLNCCKPNQVGVILVNMTPWHGPSTDVGTAFEAGFMSALAQTNPHVVIVGYYEDKKVTRSFFERCKAFFKQQIATITNEHGDTHYTDPHGNTLENFGGLEDNLMICNAIEKTGGKVCSSFEEAITFAKELAVAKQSNIRQESLAREHVTQPVNAIEMAG
ncbi:MAG: nucleoside 2-deoxyribosyltransferase [Rickettsiales bacterium]|nr:nucleoside 2-deoxyribosyltransferase [Rickettsiales bacterium]